ncbi:MAG TPA: 4-hydroxy-3-methylbut-2-enyl diphosphate reductase, partial [Geobacterales bacterium]|nr:4-hydroxy-3-methylbut-2-enyl diphosphate reductase [Geobacterales bacterium]
MNIILATHAGFCFGVKRATQMAFEAAGKGGDTYTLGPIIHSPQVVHKLEELGVKVVKRPSEVATGTVIIRSHGVTAAELEEVVQRQLAIVDATCPFVKKAQEHVKFLSQQGYTVVVVGDADHPEVEGLVSYAAGPVHVVASVEEAQALPRTGKIGIVAQTTQSSDRLEAIVATCLRKGNEVRVFNTICDATAVRQKEA